MTRSESKPPAFEPGERRWVVRYAALTLLLFVPLVLAFVFVRNLYPIAASTMMRSGGDLPSGKTYYILRGETLAGDRIDLPPVGLTNALSEVTWVLVRATIDNKSFEMRSPHPANAAMIEAAGGRESLPRGARLNELLRSWGAIYNSRLPTSSPQRLRAVILDGYRWDGHAYNDYQHFIESCRVEL